MGLLKDAYPDAFLSEEVEVVEQPKDSMIGAAFNSMQMGAKSVYALATSDFNGAADMIAHHAEYNAANPPSEHEQKFSEDWQKAEGFTEGVKAVAGNLRGFAEANVKQLPNSLYPMAGMLVGSIPGLATGPGAAVASVAGGIAGGTAGNALVEGGQKIHEALQEAGINPTDKPAVAAFLEQNQRDILAKTGIKSAFIGTIDRATLGLSNMILKSPAKAAMVAETRLLSSMGVDVANKAAVQSAMQTPEFIAGRAMVDAAFKAQTTGMRNLGRNLTVAALEPAGEFVGEVGGEELATGNGSFKDGALEALMAGGASAVTFAGQKAYAGLTMPFRVNPDADIVSAPSTEDAIIAAEKAVSEPMDDILPRDMARGDFDVTGLGQKNQDAMFRESLAAQGQERQADINELDSFINQESQAVQDMRQSLLDGQAVRREAVNTMFEDKAPLALISPTDPSGVIRVDSSGEALPETREQRMDAIRAKLRSKYRIAGEYDEVQSQNQANQVADQAPLTDNKATPVEVSNEGIKRQPSPQIEPSEGINPPSSEVPHFDKRIAGNEDTLRGMASTGIGQAERGGMTLRSFADGEGIGQNAPQGEVVNRTKWLAKSDWYSGIPDGDRYTNSADAQKAVEAAIDGRLLGKKQQRFVSALLDVIDEKNAPADVWQPSEEDIAAIKALDEQDAAEISQRSASADALIAEFDYSLSDGVSSNGMTDADIDAMFGLGVTNEPTTENAADQSQTGEATARPARTGQGAHGESTQEKGFNLEAQTESGLAEAEKAKSDAEQKAQEESDKIEQKRKADADVESFALEGQGISAKQPDMFGNSPTKTKPKTKDIRLIMVEIPVEDENGNPATIRENAAKAIENVDTRLKKARELWLCLVS